MKRLINKKNKTRITALFLSLFLINSYSTSAAGVGDTLRTFIGDITKLIGETIANLLLTVAVAFFLLAVVVFIKNRSTGAEGQGYKDAKERLGWSIVALFVMFSIWGIITFFQDSFQFKNNSITPPSLLLNDRGEKSVKNKNTTQTDQKPSNVPGQSFFTNVDTKNVPDFNVDKNTQSPSTQTTPTFQKTSTQTSTSKTCPVNEIRTKANAINKDATNWDDFDNYIANQLADNPACANDKGFQDMIKMFNILKEVSKSKIEWNAKPFSETSKQESPIPTQRPTPIPNADECDVYSVFTGAKCLLLVDPKDYCKHLNKDQYKVIKDRYEVPDEELFCPLLESSDRVINV